MSYKLEINQLILRIHIGTEKDERLKAQAIEFSLVIHFAQMPICCESDNISDALCYASIAELIEKFCLDKEFHLIEHLGFSLYQYLNDKLLDSGDRLSVKVCKSPPIASIKGNCCFVID